MTPPWPHQHHRCIPSQFNKEYLPKGGVKSCCFKDPIAGITVGEALFGGKQKGPFLKEIPGFEKTGDGINGLPSQPNTGDPHPEAPLDEPF